MKRRKQQESKIIPAAASGDLLKNAREHRVLLAKRIPHPGMIVKVFHAAVCRPCAGAVRGAAGSRSGFCYLYIHDMV